MAADLIFDKPAANTIISARLECEGEGQSELGRAVVARRNPFRTQARDGLCTESGASPHDRLYVTETQEDILPLPSSNLPLNDRKQALFQATICARQSDRR